MPILFMDSSTDALHVAVLKDGKIVYAKKIPSEKNMTEFAVSEVSSALDSAEVEVSDLTDIYVTTGPGSFTSVRIALVIAKTIISQFRGIRLWSASTLEFQLGSKDGISLINARSDSWYVAIRQRGALKTYAQVIKKEELQKIIEDHPKLPVWKDLEEKNLFDNLLDRLPVFKKADDYRKVVATYIKPAYKK